MRTQGIFAVAASLWLCASAASAGTGLAGRAAVARVENQAAVTGKTTNDRIYSAEQAREGKTLFQDVCIACHADPFWKANWPGKPLGELYTTILKYMPDDNPGSLNGREVVAVLAYILEGNGFPSGPNLLPDDPAILHEITIAEPAVK